MVKASQTVLAYTKAPVSSADTEITIRGLNDIYGNQAVMQGTLMYATIEPRSSTNQEIISFTNMVVVDANTLRLTGCTRGLKAQDSETGTARDHGANVEFILSNNPQFYETFAAVDEEETITADWEFTVSPTVPAPTDSTDAINRAYADTLAILGSPDAGTGVKGISRLSASPSTSIGTFTVTVASPAVFTCAAHGLTENDSVQLTTNGALPTGLAPSTTYYVIAAGLTSSEFRLSATYGGAAITTTGTQSGTHTLFKTTPVAVGVNDTKMLTQEENNAAGGAGGSPSSTNLFETQYDTSNAAAKTATTISFAAGTKTIADSGNGFVTANFKQGTQITVTGSASNNATYTIVSVAAGAIVVAETLVNESAGATVVMTTITANKVARYSGTSQLKVPLVPVATDDATSKSYVDAGIAVVQAEVDNIDFLQGTGAALGAKTYWNFSIPYAISPGVPSGDFWTYTNDLTTGYNSTQYVHFSPDANGAGSLMTTNNIWVSGWNTGITFATTKKVIVEWGVELEAVGTEQQGFGLSEGNAPFFDYDDASDDAACFTVSAAGALYAHTSNGAGTTNHTETLISGVTLTDLNTYRIEFDPGVDVKFYVNGDLEATISTTLPNGNAILFGCGVEGKDGGNGGITMTVPNFTIEK